MAVPLQEAVGQLQTMFPALDAQTIEEVLRQQNGHMEQTVELLLNFASEATAEDVARSAEAPRLADAAGMQVQGSAPPPTDWTNASQMEQDEALARALQNRDFQEQLRQDPAHRQYVYEDAPDGRRPSQSSGDMMKKLSDMGASAKASLLNMWNKVQQTASNRRPSLGSNSQYRSLNDDDDGPDEAEVVAFENEDSTVQRRNITDLQADGAGHGGMNRRNPSAVENKKDL